jgi:hypothetical protein
MVLHSMGWLKASLTNLRLALKNCKDKHASLFHRIASNEEKSFYRIEKWSFLFASIKTLFLLQSVKFQRLVSMVKNFLSSSLTLRETKLGRLSLAIFFSPV